MDISKITDKPFLSWIKLAFSAAWREKKPAARVHAMWVEGWKACFAVSVGDSWLCGGDGSLTVFDSPAAAGRLLDKMNISGFSHGKPVTRAISKDLPRQCFQLKSGELTRCRECAIKASAASGKPEQYSAWQEEDWSRWDEDDA